MTTATRIVRAYEATIDDVSPGERAVVARVGTDEIDRYRTVIDPLGIDLTAYNANRVVLWEHGLDPQRGALPVGKNQWIKVRRDRRELIAKTLFSRDPKDEFAERIFSLYEDGTLRGFSVNIIPDDAVTGPPTKDEVKKRPELRDCECMFRGSELCEYSAVAVPGNRTALAEAVSRGLIWVPEDRMSELRAADGFDHEKVKRDLKRIARTVVHSGKRGELHYHPEKREAGWTMAHEDGSHDDHHTRDEIQRCMRSVPGVTDCRVYREEMPDEADGWERVRYERDDADGMARANKTIDTRPKGIDPQCRDDEPMNGEDDVLPEKGEARDMADGDGDEPEEESRYIKKVGDKFVVYSEDGKVLGKHDTREDADKQLAAVEANKAKERALPPIVVVRTFDEAVKEIITSVRAVAAEYVADARAQADLTRGVV